MGLVSTVLHQFRKHTQRDVWELQGQLRLMNWNEELAAQNGDARALMQYRFQIMKTIRRNKQNSTNILSV